MYLKGPGAVLEIPVLPDTLMVESAGDNGSETVLGLGEVAVLRQKKLRSLSWDCHFPAHAAPYVRAETLRPPAECVRLVQAWRDALEPVRFILAGGDLDINTGMAVDSLSYEERGGEPGDIYYSITLREYKDYSPRRIQIDAAGQSVVVAAQRAGTSPVWPVPTRHTVVPGETLWTLAQRYYGDGGRYAEIYEANRAAMDARNAATGATRYTIYTGQELSVP